VSDLELLAQRRALLVLSARMQRAIIQVHIDTLEQEPALALLHLARRAWRWPVVRRSLLVALADLLLRRWRRARR
jgi:hypothetical protein